MIIEEYLPLVRLVAERIHRRLPPGMDLEALVQAGVAGLVAVAEQSRTRRGGIFHGYRIQGEIEMYLRSLDWVSHAVRAWGRRVVNARRDLAASLHREATVAEICAKLGVTAEEYQRTNTSREAITLLRREELTCDSEAEWASARQRFITHPSDDPLRFLRDPAFVGALSEAVSRLAERDRLVVALAHYEELTAKEIGDILNLSEEQVCDIEHEIAARLREALIGESNTINRV